MSPTRLAGATLAALALAAAPTAAATAPTLKLSPSTVKQGQNLTITGTHWPASKNVTLQFIAAGAAPATIQKVRTSTAGKFRLVLPIKPTSPTGKFKMRAVYKKLTVTKPFTVLENNG